MLFRSGKVWVESEEGLGSTFFFAVPYSPVCLSVSENTNKILIAEDDEVSYKLMNKFLSGENLSVLHAWNGEEAVCMMRENPGTAIILMDLRMPLVDGLEATRRIRQFNKTVKIIAVTINALSIDKDIAINSGCDDYILKPVNRKSFLNTIRKHLDNYKER
mgnify:FL=1